MTIGVPALRPPLLRPLASVLVVGLVAGLAAGACTQAPAPVYLKSQPAAEPEPAARASAEITGRAGAEVTGRAGATADARAVERRATSEPGRNRRARAVTVAPDVAVARLDSPARAIAPVQPTGAARTAESSAAPPRPRAKPGTAPAAPAARPEVVVVRAGESVHLIAQRHDAAVREIIDLNRLAPPYGLKVGQRLLLPAARYHTVQPGETLYGIAKLHGVEMAALVRANEIPPPYRVRTGARLRLTAPVTAPPAVTDGQGPVRTASIGANDAEPVRRRARRVPPPPRAGRDFLWPVEGALISGFGPKPGGLHNDGINIAVPPGTIVRAAENGVVAYAGNELRGYGNLVLIRHADGWMTAYAHNETLLVDRGDIIERGQPISRSGSTGRVSQPQSHFEIRRNGKARDPLPHLRRE